jgi:hypothetical protein
MNAPLPVVLAFIVLVGWPLAQILSVLAVRRQRDQLARLADQLRSDQRYGEAERLVIDEVMKQARGDPLFLLAPLLLPLGIIIMSIADLFGRGPFGGRGSMFDGTKVEGSVRKDMKELYTLLHGEAGARLSEDSRFRELESLATEIGFARSPVTLTLTAVGCLASLPFVVAAYGVNWSFRAFLEKSRHFAELARLFRRLAPT